MFKQKVLSWLFYHAISLGFARVIEVDPRIAGGQETSIEDHPWQASLQVDNRHLCSATIIGPTTLLTPAGCCSGFVEYYSRYRIVTGVTNLTDAEESGTISMITDVLIHPEWQVNQEDFDVCVLWLDEDLVFSNTTQPARLPEQNTNEDLTGLNVTVSGWGNKEWVGYFVEDIIREVSLNIIDKETCHQMYGNFYGNSTSYVTEDIICAAELGSKKGGCEYDWGGPLEDQTGTVIGMYHGINTCAEVSIVPGLYTSFYVYRDWIKSVTTI